ncbi:MAG: YIP1 family protein [Acidobacteria bacterium]|nr:YIP1 family protein [Acidobacteriota bacterium]
MNEENQNLIEQSESEWQTPPFAEEIINMEESPQMSEVATLGNIFFEPGKTFEDLRRKPRFLLAGLIIIVVVTLFNFAFIQKVGYEKIIREQLESSSRIQQMPEANKQKMIEQRSHPILKAIGYIAPPVVLIIIFLLGGLLYWLGANAMGGSASFAQGISIWIYSSFPAVVISMLANFLILFLKSVDDIEISASQNGLVQANPSFFIDAKSSPVLAAFLTTFDLFNIWGWILAAIGLRIVGKISSGAAWAIVLIVALIGVALRVVLALLF